MIQGTFVLPSIDISLSIRRIRSLLLLCWLTEDIGELHSGPEQELASITTTVTEIPIYLTLH